MKFLRFCYLGIERTLFREYYSVGKVFLSN